jgi:formate hydrogenlyase subunit 6/NADH:ubiquinone oxidoreductase subunit I
MKLFRPFSLIKNVFRKPITLPFPMESLSPVEGYRGRQSLNSEKCTGCGVCVLACPNQAIVLVQEGDKKLPQIHLGKCCFCALCAEYCPTHALTMTQEAMISIMTKDDAVFDPEKLCRPQP